MAMLMLGKRELPRTWASKWKAYKRLLLATAQGPRKLYQYEYVGVQEHVVACGEMRGVHRFR